MSAQDHEGGSPPSGAGGTPGPASAQNTGAPEAPSAGPDGGPKVLTSHGESEARAYVAPIQLPKRQRLKTMDMAKVRISNDMKVEVLDPRNMPTTRMEVPLGGIKPPPPAHAEVGDGASSPWSTSGGIDRSMLPSSSLGPTSAPVAKPQASADDDEGGRSIGIWIGVVLIAALLGGGAAYLLRGRVASSPSAISSSAPIAVTVPGQTPTPPVTAATTETPPDEEVVEPAPSGSGASSAAPVAPTGGVKVPRTTTTTTKTKTAPTTTAPQPKPSSTRLF